MTPLGKRGLEDQDEDGRGQGRYHLGCTDVSRLSGVPERVLLTGPPPGPSALAAWLLPSDQEWEQDECPPCALRRVCAGWRRGRDGATAAPWGCALA